MRDQILAAVTAALQQLPTDACVRDCERAAADGIAATVLATLPPEPTMAHTVVILADSVYQLSKGDPGRPTWWKLTSNSAASRPYTWLELWQLGTPHVLRPVPVAPRPAPYGATSWWTWRAAGGRVIRVLPGRREAIEFSVDTVSDQLSPATARLLAAVLLDRCRRTLTSRRCSGSSPTSKPPPAGPCCRRNRPGSGPSYASGTTATSNWLRTPAAAVG
jgi:hypothetical protein